MPGVRRYIARNHLGLIALFIAISGTSYAAVEIRSRDIQRDAVKSRHIDNGQVRSADVQDNGMQGVDIAEGSLGKVPNATIADSANFADTSAFADRAGSAGSSDSASSADDAALLDGLNSTAFVRRGEAVDAETLDGLDSQASVEQSDPIDADSLGGDPASAYFRGEAHRGGALIDNGVSEFIDVGDLRVTYSCPAGVSDPSEITLTNRSTSSTMLITAFEGGPGAEFFQLAPAASHFSDTVGPDDLTIFDVGYFKQGVDLDGQLSVVTTHTPSGCELGGRLVLFEFPS